MPANASLGVCWVFQKVGRSKTGLVTSCLRSNKNFHWRIWGTGKQLDLVCGSVSPSGFSSFQKVWGGRYSIWEWCLPLPCKIKKMFTASKSLEIPALANFQSSGEDAYLSTILSRYLFFCLSWVFLPACNLRLIWLISSWIVRAPICNKKQCIFSLRGSKFPVLLFWPRHKTLTDWTTASHISWSLIRVKT